MVFLSRLSCLQNITKHTTTFNIQERRKSPQTIHSLWWNGGMVEWWMDVLRRLVESKKSCFVEGCHHRDRHRWSNPPIEGCKWERLLYIHHHHHVYYLI